MNVTSLKLVCFSPTGTTRLIVQSIAHGINQTHTELIDITKPIERQQGLQTSENELLIIAVPVYLGRVPALLSDWLNSIRADGTPAVCVVVYGNRDFGDALVELRDAIRKCGGIPIACAAFIGEHSFASPEIPIAIARPDANDLDKAELFGRKINETLRTISSVDHIPDIIIPGNYPYSGDTHLWDVDFIAINDNCMQCGICAEGCPVDAIDSEQSSMIDIKRCITCCACIKNCPQDARTMKNGPVKDVAIKLSKLYYKRKEPELFI